MRFLFSVAALATVGFSGAAGAATIIDIVGTIPPGCSTLISCPDGTDVSGTLTGGFIRSDFSWTHSYAPITGAILSATLDIDLIDADRGKLKLYQNTLGGAWVGRANPAGKNNGGRPGPWRVPGDPLDPIMTIKIRKSFFADLADGSFTFYGDNKRLGFWGANQATLTITTDGVAGGGISPVPLPASLPLLAGGIGALAVLRRKRKSKKS